MKIDDVIASMKPTSDPAEIVAGIDQLLMADDIGADERGAFCAGHLTALALATYLGPTATTAQLLARMAEWTGRGWP